MVPSRDGNLPRHLLADRHIISLSARHTDERTDGSFVGKTSTESWQGREHEMSNCCSSSYVLQCILQGPPTGRPTHCATHREKGPGRRSTRSDGLKRLKNCRSTHRLARALGQRRISRWLAHSCNCPNRVAWPSSGGAGWWCQSPSSPSPG